ncbi:MAG: lytic transglycosylase domain-containing protein [Thermoanaerobaculia bacterium]
MKRLPRRLRTPLTLMAAVLFLAFLFESTPSDTAPTDPYLRPPPVETQDIARFLVNRSGASDGQFHVFRAGDLEAAVDPSPEPRQLSLLDSTVSPESRRRLLRRMPYGKDIVLAAERHQVDGLLLAAIIAVESDFTPHAVSSQGALGLMQVIPELAADYGVKGDLLDPRINVEVGSRYVSGLIKDYKGDLERTLAAYNAGPGAVQRYKGVPPFAETRGFVREVLAHYAKYTRKAEAQASRQASRLMASPAKTDRASARKVSARGKTKSRLKPAEVWRIKSRQITR